jgi:hypothetical protein
MTCRDKAILLIHAVVMKLKLSYLTDDTLNMSELGSGGTGVL